MHSNQIGKFAVKFWMEIPTQFPFAQLDVFVIMPNHMHGILIIDKNEMGGAVEMASETVETRFIASPSSEMPATEPVQTRLIASLQSQSQSPSESPETVQTRFIDENTETRLIASLQSPEQSPETVETRLIASPLCESTDIEKTRLIASLQSPATPPPVPGGITGPKNPMLHENISRILRWYKGRCTIEIHNTHPHFAWQPRFHDHVIRNEKSLERIRNYIINNPYNWKKDKFHS